VSPVQSIVMTRPHGDGVEIQVLTLWASMDAIARFAPEAALAVVEPEARGMLRSFDERVSHAEIALVTRAG